MSRLRLRKPIHNILRRYSANIGNFGKGIQRCFHESIHAAEGGSKNFTGFLTNLANTKCKDQSAQILLLTRLNGRQKLFSRNIALLPQRADLLQSQIIYIRRRCDQLLINKRIHYGRAKTINIHGITADKVGNVSGELRRTLRSRAAQECALLILLCRRTAHGTNSRQNIGNSSLGTLRNIHFQDLRDDLTGLADHYSIADTNVTLRNKVLVMQGRICDGSTCQTNRLHHSLRSQNTGSANLHNNILNDRRLDLRWILVSNRPLREFGCSTNGIPLIDAIHLNNCAINIARQCASVFVNGKHILADLIAIRRHRVRNDLEMQVAQKIKRLTMGRKLHTLCQLNIKHQNVKSTGCSDLGIKLPQRARSRISGVRKKLFTLQFHSGIQLFKAGLGHIDLATNDQLGRRIVQHHRNGANGLQIFRNIFANDTITTGRASHENTIFILQRNRQTVNLRLNCKLCARISSRNTLDKLLQLIHRENILQTHERYCVRNFLELTQRFTTNAFCGRVGRCQFRMRHLQVFQFPQKAVIFKIRHLRIIQHIIPIVGFLQNTSKGNNSLFRIHIILRNVKMFPALDLRSPFQQ